jgi:hypothetical protein
MEPRLNGKVRFGGREIEVSINDRLLAPNTPATREAADAEFRSFFFRLLGDTEFDLAYEDSPRNLFSVTVTIAQPVNTFELLNNLQPLAVVPERE